MSYFPLIAITTISICNDVRLYGTIYAAIVSVHYNVVQLTVLASYV